MALTVKRAGADEYGSWIKMLVVGDPGSGKTRTASCWPDVLYANCEAGLMSVADRQPATVDITQSSQFKELLSVLGQKPDIREKMLGVPCQTVVIDTLDEVSRILVKERLDSERKETFGYPDWGWLGEQLRNLVRAFRNLDLNVIFNVHLKSQEDSDTGRTVYKPGLQGAMSDEVAAYVDLAVLLLARPVTKVIQGQNVRQIARFLQTFPDSQHPWVKDRSGKLPMEFPIDFDTDYERLQQLIYTSTPAVGAPVMSDLPTPTVSQAPAAPQRTTGAAKTGPDPHQPSLSDAPAAPAAETAPEPQPQPPADEAPVSDPEPTPAPEPEPAPEPTPEPTPEPEAAPASAPESVPETGTAAESPATQSETTVEEWETCQGCGGKVESKDQADLSFIRHHEHLCRKCFADRKKAKK